MVVTAVLLALPLALMGIYALRHREAELSPYIGAVAMILGTTLLDMLLNATLTPFTWLTAGAVLGYVERVNPRRAAMPRHALRSRPVLGQKPDATSRSVM